MDWTPLSLRTFTAQIPKIVNDNFKIVENYINGFYDEKNKVLIKPLTTKGRVKGASGEFVNVTVDNLTVKNQFTNMFENSTTADYNWYVMMESSGALLRDPCTASDYWPYENPAYKVVDINKPYYKLSNTEPVQLYNENLSQVVGFYLDPSISSGDDWRILIDPCTGTDFAIDPSYAGMYVEFIAYDYDPSWGSKWEQYKRPAVDAGAGGGGTGIYEPTLADTLSVPSTVGGITAGTTVGDLRGDTFTELWNNLLFPTVLASVNPNHSATLSGISATTVEVGTSYTPSTSGIFNPGSINNGDGTAGPNLVGDANQFTFHLPGGAVDETYVASGNTQSHSFSAHSIAFGPNVWQVQASYDAGSGVYYDNKGNPGSNLDVLRDPSTDVINSPAVTGRRYAWYGSGGTIPSDSVGVRALTGPTFLSPSNTGTINIIIPAGVQTNYFYIPYGKSVHVLLVDSNADVTDDFDISDISVNDAGGVPQNYEAWTNTIGGVGYPAQVTYRATIS